MHNPGCVRPGAAVNLCAVVVSSAAHDKAFVGTNTRRPCLCCSRATSAYAQARL